MKILENKIQNILDQKKISIRKLSEDLNFSYSVAHRIATTDYLDTTQVIMLERVAHYLNLTVSDLYNSREDEYIMIKNLAESLLLKVKVELEERGFIDDSDNTDRFLDAEAYKLLKKEYNDEDKAFDMVDILVEEVKDIFSDDIKQAVYDDSICYYTKQDGLREWIDLILTNETSDTHSQQDVEELLKKLI